MPAGQLTTTEALSLPLPSLVEVKLPVLLIVAQLAKVVGLVTCTLSEPVVAGRVTAAQLSCWSTRAEPSASMTVQVLDGTPFRDWEAMVQTRPVLSGRLSARVTPVADPAPVLL